MAPKRAHCVSTAYVYVNVFFFSVYTCLCVVEKLLHYDFLLNVLWLILFREAKTPACIFLAFKSGGVHCLFVL